MIDLCVTGTRVDTGTFTRPKHKKHRSKLVGPDHLERPVIDDTPMSQEEDETYVDGMDMDTSTHRLTNVSDVQTLARMQEESKYIKTRIE